MSQSCGEMKVMEGGVLLGVTVNNSHITNSTIQASTLDACSITNLTGLDQVSAERIASVLAGLPSDKLSSLAAAVMASIPITPTAKPVATDGTDVSTHVYGSRAATLGEPTQWLQFGNGQFSIPVYART